MDGTVISTAAWRVRCFEAAAAAARPLLILVQTSSREILTRVSHWTPGDALPDGELRVWLDDDLTDRPAPEGWLHVTNAAAACELLATGRVVELSLDHDLGDDSEHGRGIDVVDFLSEQQFAHARPLWPRDGITLHTANPEGRDQMARGIERYAAAVVPVKRVVTSGGKTKLLFGAEH